MCNASTEFLEVNAAFGDAERCCLEAVGREYSYNASCLQKIAALDRLNRGSMEHGERLGESGRWTGTCMGIPGHGGYHLLCYLHLA